MEFKLYISRVNLKMTWAINILMAECGKFHGMEVGLMDSLGLNLHLKLHMDTMTRSMHGIKALKSGFLEMN